MWLGHVNTLEQCNVITDHDSLDRFFPAALSGESTRFYNLSFTIIPPTLSSGFCDVYSFVTMSFAHNRQ